ncbi:hypothetical protein EMCG_05188 [[Emmonsia] crescens]|uniref:Aminoglycoside phosphotransferase domain-containing protein n=1 Tax=[Emmonsia] crescens TaxID=73230 RepID=A0A0G2HQW1_9EURO|nr:hypothetical protein EMCG_05188 [Emmonsia crescens UAMH 3008]
MEDTIAVGCDGKESKWFLSSDILNISETCLQHSEVAFTREDIREPKLKRFIGHQTDIVDAELVGGGDEGIVFKFDYGSQKLCFKLVSTSFLVLPQRTELIELQFKPWSSPLATTIGRQQELLSPYASECRAFARLCDAHRNGTWAVRCHGWMYLNENQLALLPVKGDYTPWAIVKDFIPNQPSYTDIKTIIRKFEIPKSLGILPATDLHPRNYRGSFIVDLGGSRTRPIDRRFLSKYGWNHFYETCSGTVARWNLNLK